ncbi:MAG: type II toxin-antitoxin system VapC family toxin [Burkholderiales bacterium]|nr:type II toxin-antitoxin system VapC family toxin [Phycisphaerae bacterium]
MILVDTNVILGFLHPDPREKAIVRRQLTKINSSTFQLVPPVLQEVMSFLRSPRYMDLFLELIEDMNIEYLDPGNDVPWREVLAWLKRYAEHRPDYADGYLVVLSGVNRKYKVWTNDREFRTIWRRPDGSAVPLAVRK